MTDPTKSASYLNKPFEEWTRDDAFEAITAQRDADLGSDTVSGEEAYEANRRYVEEGDHWQDGDAWPMTHSDPTIKAAIRATAEPIFCAVDAIEKCVGRQVDGLLGTQPAIVITPLEPGGKDGAPSDAQSTQIAEMRDALSQWWDGVKLWERLREAARRAAWAKRGPLRLRFLPDAIQDIGEGENTKTGLRTDLDFRAALELVYLSAPLPDAALLYTDERTQETAAIITYQDEDDERVAELWYETEEGVVRRILDGEDEREEPLAGGRLPIAEIRGPLTVTDSLRRQQRRRDYFETILTRIIEAAGFRERYTANAVPNGIWSRTKPSDGLWLDARTDENGAAEYLLPVPRIMGNGVLTELQGRVITSEDGRTTLATPTVTVIEPVDPEFAIKGAAHAQVTILESCDQLHILDGDKAVSGYSKRQSRFNFAQRLGGYRASTEDAIVKVLEGAIANALLMTKPADPARAFLDEYRITVTLKIDTGPLSSDEETAEMESAKALFKARSTVQQALGVEDTEAENRAILADPIQGLDVAAKRGEVLTSWGTSTNLDTAVEAAGVTGDLAAKARRTDGPTPEQ